MSERFMKNFNGEKIFSLEYDKETLRDMVLDKQEEIERLHTIIKEVREYIMLNLITEWDIKNNGCVSGSDLPADAITPILNILDKENKND